jgi:hypothetical protein
MNLRLVILSLIVIRAPNPNRLRLGLGPSGQLACRDARFHYRGTFDALGSNWVSKL